MTDIVLVGDQVGLAVTEGVSWPVPVIVIDAELEGVLVLLLDPVAVLDAVLDPVFVTVGVKVGVIGGETLLVAV